MKLKDLRIMMTGAGAPGAPGIIRCYRNNGERNITVIGVDAKAYISTIYMLDGFVRIPSASDPDFADRVLDIAIDNNINVIQPLVTRELEIFAQNADRFREKGIAVCVSPIESLSVANDKGELLKRLDSENIPTPKHMKVTTVEEFTDACQMMGYPDRPVCFKPTRANGSRGFRIIDNSIKRSKILFEQKPNSVYLDHDSAVDILGEAGSFPELLVMEYMPGDEYSIDMLLDHGDVLYAIPRIRNVMTGGISTDCTVVDEEDVREYAVSVATALNLHGNIGIQVRRDINGAPRILEINPRVQGSIVCCAAAGINLPYFGIKLALGEDIPSIPVRYGVRMLRHWSECFYDSEGRSYTY